MAEELGEFFNESSWTEGEAPATIGAPEPARSAPPDPLHALAQRILPSIGPLAPTLRRLGPVAARVAGGRHAANRADHDAAGWSLEGPLDLLLEEALGLDDGSAEDENTGEEEHEPEITLPEDNAARPEDEALAKTLAAAAAIASSPAEASGLLGGGVIQIVTPLPVETRRVAAPILIGGGARLVRMLHGHPHGRLLMPLIPSIHRCAVHRLMRGAASGRPVTRADVARALARSAGRIIASPRNVAARRRMLPRRPGVLPSR